MSIKLLDNLKNRRMELGMSQDFVANQVGITLDTYVRYENGNQSIPSHILASLFDFLELELVAKTSNMGVNDTIIKYLDYWCTKCERELSSSDKENALATVKEKMNNASYLDLNDEEKLELINLFILYYLEVVWMENLISSIRVAYAKLNKLKYYNKHLNEQIFQTFRNERFSYFISEEKREEIKREYSSERIWFLRDFIIRKLQQQNFQPSISHNDCLYTLNGGKRLRFDLTFVDHEGTKKVVGIPEKYQSKDEIFDYLNKCIKITNQLYFVTSDDLIKDYFKKEFYRWAVGYFKELKNVKGSLKVHFGSYDSFRNKRLWENIEF